MLGTELFPRLSRLAVPTVLANLLQMTYTFVDAWFLGRIGAAAVSAPGSTVL